MTKCGQFNVTPPPPQFLKYVVIDQSMNEEQLMRHINIHIRKPKHQT